MGQVGSDPAALAAAYDYIVVGAGSAGCVLAARLSEDPAASVLLIEAGPKDDSWQLSMPAALTYPLRSTRFNWAYETEPQAQLDGRRLFWPRGRVLGGSSSINGMVWIRGHPWDFDNWAGQGLAGWAYCQVLPSFKKLERWSEGADGYRGGEGPVGIQRGRYPNLLFPAYIEAGRQAGFPVSRDFNGRAFEGFGRFDMNIWQGRRQSAAVTHLRPALGRDNLSVLVESLTSRVLVEGGRACGVEVIDGDRPAQGPRRARGNPFGRRGQLAPAALALWHRAGRRAGGAGHSGGLRLAGGRA